MINYQFVCENTRFYSRPEKLPTRAQLFEGRLAINPGLNLTWVSFPCIQKHFLQKFLVLFLELPIINL